MVLSHSNSLITVITLIAALSVGLSPEASAQAQQRAPNPLTGGIVRYGLGLLTLPQQLDLKSSDGRSIEVSSVQTGPLISLDYERRSGRWVYLGAAGISYLSMKNTSQDNTVQYAAGTDFVSFIADVGAHYIPASRVKLGASFWLFYNSFDLPVPSSPGVTYEFDAGSPLKNFISGDLNWQFYRGWILSQSLLIPISKDMRTGWVIALKARF